MSAETTVLIADDHPIFREGLRRVLEKESRFKIIAEAEDGLAALKLLKSAKPTVALLDIEMPSMSGLEVARHAQSERLSSAIVILTLFKDADIFNQAMDYGVKGFVLKDNAVIDIVHCLRAVAAGEYFLSPAISHLLMRRTDQARGLAVEQPGLQDLTPSERRILLLVAAGKTSREIGAELFVSAKTIENHRFNIAAKLNVHGPNALLKFALENRSRL